MVTLREGIERMDVHAKSAGVGNRQQLSVLRREFLGDRSAR